MEQTAEDAWVRGCADALIVSGTATGKETSLDDVSAAKRGAPQALVLIGSGITPDNLQKLLETVDGAIVGTYVKEGGKLANPVSTSRVKELTTLRDQLVSATGQS